MATLRMSLLHSSVQRGNAGKQTEGDTTFQSDVKRISSWITSGGGDKTG
jgi:hypothetical protein